MDAKLQALKVTDLKKLLQDANLPVSGAKAELIKRLLENPNATASLGGGEEEDLLGEYETEPAAASAPPEQESKANDSTASAAKAPTEAKTGSATPKPEATTPTPAAPSEEEQKASLVAELEKRKARAARWGLPTGDAEAKLERAIKFGLEASKDNTLSTLDGGLKGGKKREPKGEAKVTNGEAKQKVEKANSPAAKPQETEEEKAARIARQEADEAAKKKRAERFGIQINTPASAPAKETKTAAISSDPAEEEKKRKRMEKFGGGNSAEPADKKVKT